MTSEIARAGSPAGRRGLLGRAFAWLPYLNLLRVVLAAAALLCLLPAGLFFAPAASLLRGLFDLDLLGVALATTLLANAALSLLVITYLILINGGERFGARLGRAAEDQGRRIRISRPGAASLVFALLPLPALGAIWAVSPGAAPAKLAAVAAGLVVALLLTQLALLAYYAVLPPEIAEGTPVLLNFLELPGLGAAFRRAEAMTGAQGLYRLLQERLFPRVPAYLGRGYLDYDATLHRATGLYPGHVLALGMSGVTLLVYLLMWGVGDAAPAVPALGFLLLLLLLLIWLLAGAAFFLDRYRWPLLRLAVVWGMLTSLTPASDYFYPVQDAGAAPPAPVVRLDDAERIIVVAANGGGIQSAAWTAQVLTGLERQARAELGPGARSFGGSVRFISGVSGGSVGAMYVVGAYGPGGLPAEGAALDAIVERAAASSIADVVWGLAYPDLMRTIVPNPLLRMDRGRALEQAWRRQDPALGEPLASWRAGVAEGWRPATVFNATTAETGERLLFSTAGFAEPPRSGHLFDLEGADVAIATAARLSATFPYVTPAARAERGAGELAALHVGDGGYYDNYGMVTLVEWLDQTLRLSARRPARVLVLQIRGAPGADDPQYQFADPLAAAPGECPREVPRETPVGAGLLRGWLYQLSAPFSTMLHVRDTGQQAHNEVELELLRRAWAPQGVTIETAVFQFYGESPPLSWHLTERERAAIGAHWAAYVGGCFGPARDGWARVREFLSR